MQKLIRRLWPRTIRAIAQPAPSVAPEDLAEIAILETGPLYAAPEPLDPELLVRPRDHLITHRMDGPLASIAHEALEAAVGHAAAHPDVEVGGICVGRAFTRKDDSGILIRVEAVIRAEHTVAGTISQGEAFLTFTPESWRSLIDAAQRDFPDLRVLGWYHSHPGFGIFLSQMDTFIHQRFFTEPWHVALVVDPMNRQAGMFVRSADGRLAPGILGWDNDLRTVRSLDGETALVTRE